MYSKKKAACRKVIFISGPFHAVNAWERELNIRRAEVVALEVWKAGAVAICPHTNTAHFEGALQDHVWLLGDMEIMRRCDAVMCVEGWDKSVGSRLEVDEAKRRKLPVFYDINQLTCWLKH